MKVCRISGLAVRSQVRAPVLLELIMTSGCPCPQSDLKPPSLARDSTSLIFTTKGLEDRRPALSRRLSAEAAEKWRRVSILLLAVAPASIAPRPGTVLFCCSVPAQAGACQQMCSPLVTLCHKRNQKCRVGNGYT